MLRNKAFFYLALALVSAWIVNRLLRRQPDQETHHNTPVQTSNWKNLSQAELLFHEFDTQNEDFSKEIVSKDEHAELMRSLDEPIDDIDEQVKTLGDRLFSFNLLASNRVGLYRPLPDTRNHKCPSNPSNLRPINITASIIICYYNEAPSALFRTLHTVLRRTEPQLIREIILIDDHSEDDFNIYNIKQYLPKDISLIFTRTDKREGLIRARLLGADMASGDALVFLDSHVEANQGWLDPLLLAVQDDKSTVACPIIDIIKADTLKYSASPMVKGGLKWNLHFKWDSVPSDKLKTYDDFVKPIESPTMAGGLYAIDRQYFYHLGTYDKGMELWGGENIEFSLRVWMCGGKIVILPCSRLGHIFRNKRPYDPEPDKPDSLLFNSLRSAKVWLDDYIEKYYDASPGARSLESGDISERIQLRRNLNCHNFSWFLHEIYPPLLEELKSTE